MGFGEMNVKLPGSLLAATLSPQKFLQLFLLTKRAMSLGVRKATKE